jgi:hypothetical protein
MTRTRTASSAQRSHACRRRVLSWAAVAAE